MIWMIILAFLVSVFMGWALQAAVIVPRKTGLEIRSRDYYVDAVRDSVAAKSVDPYDTAYPIVTAGQVLDGLSAELQMFLGPAGLPCPKAWTKGNHTWQLRRNPGPSYYWKCGSCPATTDEKTLPLLQGWEPTPREVVQFTGRPLPPKKTTHQYLRDLDASLELEAQVPTIEIETFGQIGTRVYNGSTWV